MKSRQRTRRFDPPAARVIEQQAEAAAVAAIDAIRFRCDRNIDRNGTARAGPIHS